MREMLLDWPRAPLVMRERPVPVPAAREILIADLMTNYSLFRDVPA
jgi:hypothetical protein